MGKLRSAGCSPLVPAAAITNVGYSPIVKVAHVSFVFIAHVNAKIVGVGVCTPAKKVDHAAIIAVVDVDTGVARGLAYIAVLLIGKAPIVPVAGEHRCQVTP